MNTNNGDDPIVDKKIGKKYLQMRLSHKLPYYYNEFPFYDRALPRICTKLNEIDGFLTVIDVGANIGDTISLITDEVQGSFLCIEGDKEFLPFLKKNAARIRSSEIIIEESYCSEDDKKDETYRLERYYGTAYMVPTKENKGLIKHQFKSLDRILDNHELFKKANLIKIDTDGFEINVLNGCRGMLKKALPSLYLEFFPEFYRNNGQDPMLIFKFLHEHGYEEALMYDNFGLPMEIINTADEKKIKEMIALIDNKKIYYYDILTCHHSKIEKYKEIFSNELKVGVN
jgi:FkbM family methyltransferase